MSFFKEMPLQALVPFHLPGSSPKSLPSLGEFQLRGEATRNHVPSQLPSRSEITLRFAISGGQAVKGLQSRVETISRTLGESLRRTDLWATTCFEAFFSRSQAPDAPYFEFNFSPHGEWNFYRLDGYRKNLRPDRQVSSIHAQWTAEGIEIRIPAEGELADAGTGPLWVSLTAVIESASGEKSYWALRHPAAQPDFHDKKGFILCV